MARATDGVGITRVLLVDDHQALSDSLALAIGLQDDLECVGAAPTVAGALEMVARHSPDVVLMDLRLPDADGIEGTARIKAATPEARVVILTAHADLEVMARAAAAGASGFLPKTSSIAEILRAIREAVSGGLLVEHSTLVALLERLRALGTNEASDAGLTPREHDVLFLMAEGLDPRAIARRLGIRPSTCRGHVQNILRKLGVHSQLEAVVSAVRRGLVPNPAA